MTKSGITMPAARNLLCSITGRWQMKRALLATRGLLTLLAFLTVLQARTLQAQVALDVNSGPQTSLTWTHNVGGGSNLAMVVAVSISATGTHVTSVTWSGTSPVFSCLYAMDYGESATSCGNNGVGSARRVEIWGGTLGSLGATNGTITVALSSTSGISVVAGSASLKGAAQTGTFGTAKGTTGTATPASLPFSALPANGLVMDAIAISTSQPITSFGSGQTQLWKAANGSNVYGAASYAPGSVTSISQSWTGGTTHWAYVAVPINPASATGRKGQTIMGMVDFSGDAPDRTGF